MSPTTRAARTYELSSDVRVAVNRLARRLRAEKADDALSDGQTTVLGLLYRHGRLTLSELSEHERVTLPSMNRTVGILVEAGYVTREQSADDRRKTLHLLTPAGIELVEATQRRRDEWLFEKLATLTDDERSDLAAATVILRRLTER